MQGNDSYRLIVRRGPQPNQTYDLNKDIITLGRDITNDITINDPEVSRHHLRLTRGAGGYTIEDLGSTNGTFVNGQRLTGARPLNIGDMVGLGETVTLGYDIVRGAAMGAAPDMAPTVGNPAQQPGPAQNPYAPPAPAGAQSYANPQQAPQQPNYSYSQPPQQQQPGAQQSAYGQPGAQQYYTPPYGAPPTAPPAAGYEYDPYAVREDEPASATRWIIIGCAGLALFCCCTSVIGLVIIDTMNLWYDIPIVKDIAPLFENIARALGLVG